MISSLRAWSWCWALVLCGACSVSVDPNKGHFGCTRNEDCGTGYGCKAQLAGGSLCFPSGPCTEELCDGLDNDCNGAIDDAFVGKGEACSTGLIGVCGVGARSCVDGVAKCSSTTAPSVEVCDNLDNNCDGRVDEGFNLASDPQNCGACGTVCGAGTACKSYACREAACGDGLDNDGDTLVDCDDPDCAAQACNPGDAGVNCGSSPVDAGLADAGLADAGLADAGLADSGVLDAGVLDAGPPDGGTRVRACVPRETACADGADNDGDGLPDCADPDCDGLTCGAMKSCQGSVCQ